MERTSNVILDTGEYAPMRLYGLIRLLAERRSCDVEEIQALMHPRSVWSDPELKNGRPNSMVAFNLRLAQELSFANDEEGKVSLHPDLPKDVANDYEQFLYQLGHRLLGKTKLIATDVWEKQHQFSKMIAWFLSQSVSRPPKSKEALADSENEFREPEFKPMGGGVVGDQFFLWGPALGLFTFLRDTNLTLLDPSPFLRRHLHDFTPRNEWITIHDWIHRLGSQFPVFETGWVREAVSPWGDRVLSEATSFALDRFRREGLMELDFQADAGTGLVYRLGWGGDEQITRLRWKEGMR